MDPINVLVSLHRGYGLGDAVQVSVVLQHLRKYRPYWRIDYQAEEGRYSVGRGLAQNVFSYGTNYPTPVYDAEFQVCLYDRWCGYTDRPNTHVTYCLGSTFGIDWDKDCGSYHVQVRPECRIAAGEMLRGMWEYYGKRYGGTRPKFVALHYLGDSCPEYKNLSHEQADIICDKILAMGRVPLIIDWRDTSPLPGKRTICGTGKFHYSRKWGASAEMNCAVLSQCEAFVGIDSGPSKCASAVGLPSLVVWAKHHPCAFHDPMSTTTHLVPSTLCEFARLRVSPHIMDWFNLHYKTELYQDDPINEVCRWLEKTLV